ncbi:hypothetical protein CKO_02015 [Citrobacter koseri ATCC BAA-895]|uniref:Uncharacterized protein n=1 Tax=Citrobacter koseri (strain ATCC BAA-895 / CDC 4225-83 / SGSC4696) TaxID=290338 RepID=A8AI27_CITK8|nr:hypothetical protein CKO_02015 [Citrobacter koseri ATCC BAA-895]
MRFQFMGTSEGDIAIRSVMRCLRYHQNKNKAILSYYAPAC